MPYKDPEKQKVGRKVRGTLYRQSHRQELNEKSKQWSKEHKEKRAIITKRYRLTHQEEVRAYKKAYNASHRQEHTEYARQWRKEHRDRSLAITRNWRHKHPEARRAAQARRRARLRNAIIEPVNYIAIDLRDAMICGLCHKRIARKDLTYDHIVPLVCGGSHVESNLQVAHLSCNSAKRDGRLPSQMRLVL